MSRRLQGEEWKYYKKFMVLKSITVSEGGNIRANMQHKKTDRKYHHWLSPKEIEKFTIQNKQIYEKYHSEFLKTQEIINERK